MNRTERGVNDHGVENLKIFGVQNENFWGMPGRENKILQVTSLTPCENKPPIKSNSWVGKVIPISTPPILWPSAAHSIHRKTLLLIYSWYSMLKSFLAMRLLLWCDTKKIGSQICQTNVTVDGVASDTMVSTQLEYYMAVDLKAAPTEMPWMRKTAPLVFCAACAWHAWYLDLTVPQQQKSPCCRQGQYLLPLSRAYMRYNHWPGIFLNLPSHGGQK